MGGLPFFSELFEALWESNNENITDNLDFMSGEYNPTHSRPIDEKALICQAFAEAFRLVLIPHQKNYTHYPRILEMFLRYAKFYADQEPWSNEIHKLFFYADKFAPSYFDSELNVVLTSDFIFTEHVRQMESFLGTGLFSRWVKLPGNLEFLKKYQQRSLEFLLYATLNCCDELFASQIRLNASLLAHVPELLSNFKVFIRVVSYCQSRAFRFQPEQRTVLQENLARITASSKFPESIALLNELALGLDQTAAPVARPVSKKLSVEDIYHAALQDIMADEILSPEENEMIRSLREFVPIAPDVYQKIFDQTLNEKKASPVTGAGEFDAGVFMRRLINDYRHELDEKACEKLIATGDALLLSRKEVRQWLEEATQQAIGQTGGTQALTWPGIFPSSVEVIAKLGEIDGLSGELQASGAFAKIATKAAGIYKIMCASAAETAPEHAEQILSNNSCTAFLSEPIVVKVPTLVFFVFSPLIHHHRLQFKGETLQVYLRSPIDKLLATDFPYMQGDILHIFNGNIDRVVDSQWHCKEGMEGLAAGFEKSAGAYRIALVGYPTMTPIKIYNLIGGMDLTGRFAQAEGLFSGEKYNEAIEAFEALALDQPGLGQVSYMLARSYKTLAQADIEPEKNFALAEKCYHDELKKNPTSIDAMLGLGIICKRVGDFVGAEKWFEQALKVAPSCIPLIITWVTTRMSRLTQEKHSQEDLLEDICRNLGPCYFIDPDSHDLKEAVDYLSSILKKFIPGYINLTAVDYRNM